MAELLGSSEDLIDAEFFEIYWWRAVHLNQVYLLTLLLCLLILITAKNKTILSHCPV